MSRVWQQRGEFRFLGLGDHGGLAVAFFFLAAEDRRGRKQAKEQSHGYTAKSRCASARCSRIFTPFGQACSHAEQSAQRAEAVARREL